MFPLIKVGSAYFKVYGLFVVSGIMLGIFWLLLKFPSVRAEDEELGHFWGLVYSIVIGGIIGAKAAFFLVEWPSFFDHPARMLYQWRAGWVFWGSVAGSMLGGKLYQFHFNRGRPPGRRRRYLPIADYMVVALPIGHWLGRVGCFFNGCCHGRPTEHPWGVSFTHLGAAVPDKFLGVALHPTQLYEAAAELLMAVLLAGFVQPRIEAGRFKYGTSFFGYILLYSGMRFVVEFFRGDDRGSLFGSHLSPSQWFSLAGFAAAGAMLARGGIVERRPKSRSLYY